MRRREIPVARDGRAPELGSEIIRGDWAEGRLAVGTYGRSIESGKPIPDEHPEVRPTAERMAEEDAH
jgi:RNA polymerase-binding transcription factor DksA